MYSHVSEPLLPNPWSNYKIWQYASNASYPSYSDSGDNSISWGSQYSGLDMNWFNGSYDDLLVFCNKVSSPEPEPEPIEALYKAEVTATDGLFVRNAPNPIATKITALPYKRVVDIYEENDVWRKISPISSEWCNGTWLSKIPDIIVPEPNSLGKFKVTSNEYINIRGGAGTEYSIVGTLPEGSIVDAYVITSKWLKISASENKWIYKQLTVPYSDGVPEEIGELDYLYFPFNEQLGFPITQLFGKNPSWYPSSGGHNGIDYGIAPYNEIFAVRSGTVIRADYNSDGYGRSVFLQHFDDNQHKAGVSIYGHLKEFRVKVGDVVKSRQIVGLSNGELSDPYRGFSTGAHLHIELRADSPQPPIAGSKKYNAIDPLPLFRSWDWEKDKPLIKLWDGKVSAHGLRVRVGAGINFREIDYYYYGADITVYQERGDWLRVSPVTNRWINKNFVTKI
jgi:murein DD-endopeptidase MepM/ murein hydrolase activator NlpD